MSKGIDMPIDNLVAVFNSNLWAAFNTDFVGRIFHNVRHDPSKISPEKWLSGNNYKEVLKDISIDGQCFFDVRPRESGHPMSESDVRICFMVNLSIVYPSLTRREATEQSHIDTLDIIKSSRFKPVNLIRGFEGFEEYDWGEGANQAKSDMHPHYLFRYDTELKYQIINC